MTHDIAARRPIARMALLVILIGLGARFVQTALGDAPSAEAARAHGPRELLRVAWPTGCGPDVGLGLYAAADAPCRPSRAVSLNWLQGQLASAGLLSDGEYLEAAQRADQPACGAAVLRADGSPAGWLCADNAGLFRQDAAGRDPGGRWQLWSDGAWQQVR